MHRLAGDLARFVNLSADFVHRTGHLLGGTRHRLDIAGGLLGRRRDHA
jgi:hypothetical protein